MREINLLPKKYLLELKLNRLSRRIIAIGAIIFLFTVFAVLTVEVSIAKLEKNVLDLNEIIYSNKYTLSDKVSAEHSELKERIKEIEMLEEVVHVEQFITKERFHTIFRGLPEDTKTYEITINNKNRTAVFTGISDTRNSVIAYSDWIAKKFYEPKIISLAAVSDNKSKFILEWSFIDD